MCIRDRTCPAVLRGSTGSEINTNVSLRLNEKESGMRKRWGLRVRMDGVCSGRQGLGKKDQTVGFRGLLAEKREWQRLQKDPGETEGEVRL
eukprot:1233588-Rhodomonas_salina.3